MCIKSVCTAVLSVSEGVGKARSDPNRAFFQALTHSDTKYLKFSMLFSFQNVILQLKGKYFVVFNLETSAFRDLLSKSPHSLAGPH